MTDTLRERVRERLEALIEEKTSTHDRSTVYGIYEAADAILREFRLQPVVVGRVGDGGEVEFSPVRIISREEAEKIWPDPTKDA